MMMKTLFKLLQVTIDMLVGIAVFYALDVWGDYGRNTIVIMALLATAIFAEFTETFLKK